MLQAAAEYVEFSAPVAYSAVAIRFSIPDAPEGGGPRSRGPRSHSDAAQCINS